MYLFFYPDRFTPTVSSLFWASSPSPLFLCCCSSLGVHTSGFYHGCCCSCFPSISPTGQLPPLSFLFFLLCLNSMSLVCLVRPKFLCHSDLFLVCFFRNIMTWCTSHAVIQNHFLLALSLIFLALCLYHFMPFSVSIFYVSPLCQCVWKNTAASSILVCAQHRKTGSVTQEWHTLVMFRKIDTHSGWLSSDAIHFLCEHKHMLPMTT